MSNLVHCLVWILMCFEIFFARNNRLGGLFERNRCIIPNVTSIVCFDANWDDLFFQSVSLHIC